MEKYIALRVFKTVAHRRATRKDIIGGDVLSPSTKIDISPDKRSGEISKTIEAWAYHVSKGQVVMEEWKKIRLRNSGGEVVVDIPLWMSAQYVIVHQTVYGIKNGRTVSSEVWSVHRWTEDTSVEGTVPSVSLIPDWMK